MDAGVSIDVQLLCGGGLAATKAYLSGRRTEESEAALARILDCERAGDFADFSPAAQSAWYAAYYG